MAGKRILAVILAIGIAAGLVIDPGAGKTARADIVADYQVEELADATYKIVSYLDTQTKVEVPETISGKKVTVIGHRAFAYKDTLEEVTIPSSVTVMEGQAFQYCSALKKAVFLSGGLREVGDYVFDGCALEEIVLLPGVEKIGRGAFLNCTKMAAVSIPATVTEIGEEAFSGCSILEGITLPSGVTVIGKNTFSNCRNLAQAAIPDGVTSIGELAFYGCSALTQIVIPDSVTDIGRFAFERCTGMTQIHLPANVSSIGRGAFSGCEQLQDVYYAGTQEQWDQIAIASEENESLTGATIHFETASEPVGDFEYEVLGDGTVSITKYIGNGTDVTVPDKIDGKSVTEIGEKAFTGCENITRIVLPSTLERIKGSSGIYEIEGAFSNCTGLEEIVIPDNVTAIGEHVFRGCSNLKKLILPSELKSIGEDAFFDCQSLEEILIPASVTRIEDGTFFGCTALRRVMIPDGVLSIGSDAFGECTNLKEIMLPASVTSIGELLFQGCDKLIKINIPDGITSIGVQTFYLCKSLRKISIPASVTSIGRNAFNTYSTSLTDIYYSGTEEQWKQITIEQQGNQILNQATIHFSSSMPDDGDSTDFEYRVLSNKETIEITKYTGFDTIVEIPEQIDDKQVVRVGTEAFYRCSSLTQISIPASVKSIGSGAFLECSSLADVYYAGTRKQWGEISLATDSGLEDERITIHFKESDEPAIDYEYNILNDNTIEIKKYTGSEAEIKIPAQIDGKQVTLIRANVFKNNNVIKTITIPSSVTSFMGAAIVNCPNLVAIYTDRTSNSYISDDGILFNKEKTELVRVPEGRSGTYIVPAGVDTIGKYAFSRCKNLTEITVPNGVQKIKSFAFKECIGLTHIIFPESVDMINQGTFLSCSSLEQFHIPNKVKEIEDRVFMDCKSLQNIVIPDGATQIGTYSFADCENLKSITIPVSVIKISNSAFSLDNASKLEDVYYGGTRRQWEQIEVPGEGGGNVTEKLHLTATIHYKNDPIILPEEPIQPEVRDPKQELGLLKSNGSFQLDEFTHYLTKEQIGIMENYLYTWLAQVNYAYQYSGSRELKERIMKKAGIDPDGDFASGMEQAITHISVNTPYGIKTLEITMGLGKPDSTGNLYPGYSIMHYEILEKNGIPSDVPVSGQIVRNDYTDMGNFIESVKQASNDSLHGVYQWQQLEHETAAGILIDKTAAEIVGNKNGSFSDGTFTIYAKPLFAYSKIVKISCPVDVHVYGMDGKEAGSIVNNQPSGGNQHVRLDMDGETKTVYLAGEDYYLNLRGTGTGTMKYEVEEIANEEVRRNVQFLELQLKNDMLYEGYVFRPLNIDRDLYALRTVEKDGTGGEVFRSSQDSYQASFKKVQGLSLSQKNTSLESDRTIQLSASYIPLDASNPNLCWTTDNASIVRVDENGLITAVGSGQATVTVSTKDGSFLKQYCVIDVAEKSGGNSSGDNGNSNGSTDNGSGGGNGNSSGSSSGGSFGGSGPSSTTDGQDKTPVVVSLHYVLQFHANGGTNLSRRTMTLLADDSPGIMPKVQRKDYTFDGWYTDQEGGRRITGDEPLTEASTLYARWSKAQAPAKVGALTLKSRKKGQLQVSFPQVKGALGYQVLYSGSKKFTSAKTKEAGASVKTKTITGLKAGKKYYIKVRAYSADSAGNKIFGRYSAVKSVKVNGTVADAP